MSIPRRGLYNFRLLSSGQTNLGLGGMYATFRAPEQPIILAPRRPPYFTEQAWRVIPEGEDILIQAVGMNDQELTFWQNQGDEPSALVILGRPKRFRANHVRDVEGIGIYSVVPAEAPDAPFVGENEKREVALGDRSPSPPGPILPYSVWAFYPVSSE